MKNAKNMFEYKGKTTKIIGPQRIKTYKMLYNHINNLQGKDLVETLLGPLQNVHIISVDVDGNDLVVGYIFFTSFRDANLENANFKNADLHFANFYQANLINADLSGADLRNAFLGQADLSNANLNGAILDGAVLTCKNHPICKID